MKAKTYRQFIEHYQGKLGNDRFDRKRPMTEKRRELMLRVMDGRGDLAPVMFHYSHLVRCDDVLSWLVKNRITGDAFHDWFFFHHRGSILGSMEFVLRQLEGSEAGRGVFLNRDLSL